METLFKDILLNGINVREAERWSRRIAVERRRKGLNEDPEVRAAEVKLADKLGTRVHIENKQGQKGGRIVINFFSRDELHNIIKTIESKERGTDEPVSDEIEPEKVTEDDVKSSSKMIVEIKPQKDNYSKYGKIIEKPMSNIRKRISEKMSLSKHMAAHVTHIDEADATKLVEVMKKEKKAALEKDAHLTYLPFIIKAVIVALKNHKYLNTSLDHENEKIIIKKLQDWTSQDITITNNEDLRRIFVKFESKEGNCIMSGHMSIQFHVLLYYKPDNKVIELQKELPEIIDKTKNTETDLADEGEKYIIKKLKDLGYNDLSHKELFELFFENNELQEKIYRDIDERSDVDVQSLLKRKKQMFDELDNLLMECYQTSSVLIDDSKLVTGEEGFLFSLDLEYVKNNVKVGMFNTKKFSEKVKEKLLDRLDEIIKILNV
ncbi:MAG: 2-oxo acid dehydrogenase subunit E2 [Thaumarchaeota archaeon]|nr:2-oxo acid dehydrogenase subunit E2 [Nitrososphaerota archaeon]